LAVVIASAGLFAVTAFGSLVQVTRVPRESGTQVSV